MQLKDEEVVMIYKKLFYPDKGEWPEEGGIRLNILLKIEQEFPDVIRKYRSGSCAYVGVE